MVTPKRELGKIQLIQKELLLTSLVHICIKLMEMEDLMDV